MRILTVNKLIKSIDVVDQEGTEKETTVYFALNKSDGSMYEKNNGGQTFNKIEVMFEDYSYLLVKFNTDRQCCEDFGYMFSHDLSVLKDYIGANLEYVEFIDGDDLIAGTDEQTVYINFITSKGKFDLTVYNSHNGYYGHNVQMCYGKRI